MAKALRIDSIKATVNGSREVSYTYGDAPLPAEASGAAVIFTSRQEAVSIKNDYIASFNAYEALTMALAVYAIANADPGLTGAAAMVGKTLTIDPSTPAAVMVYA